MTNIYNKRILSSNQTLIENWYEEEELRRITGEGRTIPNTHIKKRLVDNSKEVMNPEDILKRDKTKVRIHGLDQTHPYDTTNQTYGDFSSYEHNFNKVGVKEKIFQDFFKSYLTNESNEKIRHEAQVDQIRLNESNAQSNFMPKDFQAQQVNTIGTRHMYTPNGLPINCQNIDKLFMASHGMSKFDGLLSKQHALQYASNGVPYYNDKEMTYWAQNLEKSNVYKSHTKGSNAFGRSHGFTQPIHNTRSASQYSGNVSNDSNSRTVAKADDGGFMENFLALSQSRQAPPDLFNEVRGKVLECCCKKGWTGIRNYKLYLFNLNKRRNYSISKADLKYFSTNFGVYFTDKELDWIFRRFDSDRRDSIDFVQFLDSLMVGSVNLGEF